MSKRTFSNMFWKISSILSIYDTDCFHSLLANSLQAHACHYIKYFNGKIALLEEWSIDEHWISEHRYFFSNKIGHIKLLCKHIHIF